MSTVQPSKRKRLQRSCTIRAKANDIARSCDLMESVQVHLSKYNQDDADIQTLLDSIDVFRRKHSTTRYFPSHEQKEQDEEEEDGIDLDDEDSWSDELSEHDSDLEFIAQSDEEEQDSSYVPSESEEQSTQDTEDIDESSQDKENSKP